MNKLLVSHTNSPLHIWCFNKFKQDEKEKKDDQLKNEKACKIIVTTAAYVLKDPAGSARDFVKLNDKDQILMECDYPQKNYGS